jgi:hypothetical protein
MTNRARCAMCTTSSGFLPRREAIEGVTRTTGTPGTTGTPTTVKLPRPERHLRVVQQIPTTTTVFLRSVFCRAKARAVS